MQTTFAYLLTAPVINPVVILTTALAFQWNWRFVVLRVSGTFVVGAVTALYPLANQRIIVILEQLG